MGQCGGAFCTSTPDACGDSGNFVPNAASCAMTNAKFGRCNNPSSGMSFCAWSASDCGTGGSFVSSSETENCDRCDDVRTGACLVDGIYWCAVNAEACANMDEFVPALTLLLDGNICRLCRPRSEVIDPPPSLGGDADNLNNDPSTPNSSDGGGLPNAAIYGIVGGLVTAILMALAFFVIRRTNRKTMPPPESKTPPIEDFHPHSMGTNVVDIDEDLSDDSVNA